jgi:hypothetical protein
MGGTIKAMSDGKSGSTFYFSIPYVPTRVEPDQILSKSADLTNVVSMIQQHKMETSLTVLLVEVSSANNDDNFVQG